MSEKERQELSFLGAIKMDELKEFLQNVGVGVLSLADNVVGYARPVSFGYNGGSNLYFFQLGYEEVSEKRSSSNLPQRHVS